MPGRLFYKKTGDVPVVHLLFLLVKAPPARLGGPKSFRYAQSRRSGLPPSAEGKRSAVAVVNDSPVDCQSRDRICRSK